MRWSGSTEVLCFFCCQKPNISVLTAQERSSQFWTFTSLSLPVCLVYHSPESPGRRNSVPTPIQLQYERFTFRWAIRLVLLSEVPFRRTSPSTCRISTRRQILSPLPFLFGFLSNSDLRVQSRHFPKPSRCAHVGDIDCWGRVR